jgi:hypothetical protein
MARVEARIRKELVIDEKPSKLVIDYGCDAAESPPRDVYFEDGSGHGGTLRVTRFRRLPDRIEVRSIASSHYYGKGIEVQSGELDARALDGLVETARVAMLARPHVVKLRPPAGAGGMGMSAWFSSNDFHLRLSLIDEAGAVTDAGFTGYDGSSSQAQIIPMRMATEGFTKLLATVKLSSTEPTAADREMLTRRFLVTMERKPYWWVEERYVALMAELGTLDAVPALVSVVADPGTNASDERAREGAIAAIAALTGWDARVGPSGAPRTLAEAAGAIVDECR